MSKQTNMIPEILTIPEKNLVGKRIRMTLSANRTAELWQSFMPRRKEIRNISGTKLFSVEIYDQNMDFNEFGADTEFEKWAAIEVSMFEEIPDGMESIILPGGIYAVFHYKGAANEAASFFRNIFTTWLPEAGYLADNRPHFEVMGEKYKGNDPTSEEEIWVPVKIKSGQSQ
jgi:AraC family transcriptional regulator